MAALAHHTQAACGPASRPCSDRRASRCSWAAPAPIRSQSRAPAAAFASPRPARSQRAARVTCAASTATSTDYQTLQQHTVYSAASGAATDLTALWQAAPGRRCVVACLTHFGDLSSTELAQKLLAVLPELQGAGVGVLVVGLGEVDKARRFAELLGFPLDILYADPSGDLYRALGFSPGFAPDVGVSAYAKLLPMLAGIGSPGTIQEVFRGYVGDRSAKPVFQGESNLFDVLGKGYQRPFELATLRLFNMQLVLTHWKELAPADERLLTQQGGCIGFDGQQTIFRHADAGILKYASVDALLAAMLPGGVPPEGAAPTQVARPLL